jgi:hypothetical protein
MKKRREKGKTEVKENYFQEKSCKPKYIRDRIFVRQCWRRKEEQEDLLV